MADKDEYNKGEIVLYQPDETVKLEVRLDNETVWLNRQQIATLFDRELKPSVSISQMPCKKNCPTFQLSQNLRQFKSKEVEQLGAALSIIILI